MSSVKEKDRDLSPLEYYDILQKEYFENQLKSKIYTRRKDKDFYKRVAGFKKEKILDISAKNGLPNIFEDKELHDLVRSQVYPDQGLPKFNMSKKDLECYFSEGSDVKVWDGEKIVLGKIESHLPNFEIIKVKIKNDKESCRSCVFKNVTRIF